MNTESTRPAIGIDIIHWLGCDNIDIGEESQYMSILMTCLILPHYDYINDVSYLSQCVYINEMSHLNRVFIYNMPYLSQCVYIYNMPYLSLCVFTSVT